MAETYFSPIIITNSESHACSDTSEEMMNELFVKHVTPTFKPLKCIKESKGAASVQQNKKQKNQKEKTQCLLRVKRENVFASPL